MKIAAKPKDELVEILIDAFETVDEGVGVFDADERLVYCNRLYREYLGPVAHLAVPGADWRTFKRAYIDSGLEAANYNPDEDFDVQADRLRSDAVRREGEVTAEGRRFEVAYTPMRNGGFVLRRKDVTERSRAEASADHYADLLKRVLEANPIPVLMARAHDGKIVWRSPAARALIGDTSHTPDQFVDPEDRKAYVQMVRETGKVSDFRTRLRLENGKIISVALSGMLTEFEGETCVVSSLTDLTEVLDSEALLRKVIEACPAPVLMNRASTGEILYRSPELVALLGEGLDATAFYESPEDRAGFLNALRRDGQVSEYRERFLNAAGEPFWAAVSGRVTEWNGEEVLVTFTRDLTPQLSMEAELDRQREMTFQNEKMSALGGLLAGVAHELNNPLSVVVGHAMMLQEETQDEATRRQIEKISAAAERCAGIVKTFLAMARQEPARIQSVDLNEVAQIAVDVAQYGDDTRSVRIKTKLDPELRRVEGDPDQLTQLVINLIINAEQVIAASGVGDRIKISTLRRDAKSLLTVQDNGPGVSAEVKKRAFEPFFTTKGVGQGTGLGLSVCHQIVTSHRGAIHIDDVKGGGACFTVELPAMDEAPTAIADAPSPTASNQSAGRVLVIDDELDVAELNTEVLTRAGYEAIAVTTAEEGLDLLKNGAFDIVLSDLNMPTLDGRALYEAILRDHPHLVSGVGFITGDTLGRSSQKFLAEAQRPYLEKPVSPKELREFVQKLREESRA